MVLISKNGDLIDAARYVLYMVYHLGQNSKGEANLGNYFHLGLPKLVR